MQRYPIKVTGPQRNPTDPITSQQGLLGTIDVYLILQSCHFCFSTTIKVQKNWIDDPGVNRA